MNTAIPDLLAGAAFESSDLAIMQSVLDEACANLGIRDPDRRTLVATAVFHAYSAGQRDRQKLLDAATAAVR